MKFGKKKKQEKQMFVIDEKVDTKGAFEDNVRTLKDAMSPSQLTVVDYNTLKVGEHFVRNYIMQGYPSYVRVG